MSVQSVCGEHMSCFCVGIPDESGGVFIIAYYTFDVNLEDLFCSFTLRTIFYKKILPAMWSLFSDHIAEDHIKQSIVCNQE